MLCLSQCSESALTRTYWPSGGTVGRNSRLPKLFLRAFFFALLLNSQAGCRCTLVPRLACQPNQSSIGRVAQDASRLPGICVR